MNRRGGGKRQGERERSGNEWVVHAKTPRRVAQISRIFWRQNNLLIMAATISAAIRGIPETQTKKRRPLYRRPPRWCCAIKRRDPRASGDILSDVLRDDLLQLLHVARFQRIDHVEVLARRNFNA
ncbi:hypothetical protein D3C71_1726850 [compost metagenome]